MHANEAIQNPRISDTPTGVNEQFLGVRALSNIQNQELHLP